MKSIFKNNVVKSVIIILTFIVSFYGKSIFNLIYTPKFHEPVLQTAYFYLWWIVPIFVVLSLMWGVKKIPDLLGLDRSVFTGFVFSVICVLPMIVSSAIMGNVVDIKLLDLLHKTIFAGFFEEFLFRGFLFGILFRKLKWGFIPAAVIGSLFFGVGHLYQGSSLAETTGVFLVTAIGALWFSWLYIEWNANLWVPVFLHTFMNLSWILFDVSNNALGGVYINIFRAITIALTIIITRLYFKKRGFYINKNNLLFNK